MTFFVLNSYILSKVAKPPINTTTIIYKIIPIKPVQNAHLVHFPACSEALFAPCISPALNFELTLAALTIPAIPNGKQQKRVTKIDSTSQVLGCN